MLVVIIYCYFTASVPLLGGFVCACSFGVISSLVCCFKFSCTNLHANIDIYALLQCCMQGSEISSSLCAVAEGYFCMHCSMEEVMFV